MSKTAESVGISMPKDIPPGWRRRTLGEIGEYINGRGFKKAEWSENGFPIIRIQNLTGTGKEQNYYNGDIDERHVVNPGDLLISWAATLGAYLWSGPRAALNQHIFKVRSFIDKKFHYYTIQNILGDLYRQTHGSGMVHITRSKFDLIPVLVPETEEGQKRIVAEIEKQFSRLDEAVAGLKRIKANLKRYKSAVLKAAVEGKLTEQWRKEHSDVEPASELLKHILAERRAKWEGKGNYKEPAEPDTANLPVLPKGWVWVKTDKIFWFVTSGSRGWAAYYSEIGPLFIRIGNLDHYSISLDLREMQRVQPPSGTEGVRTRVMPGDILVSITADVGMVALAPRHVEEAYINQHISLARPVSAINRSYLAWFLCSQDGQKQFKELQRGATKVGLGLDDIKAVNVPLPSLSEQGEIVQEIERRFSVADEIGTVIEADLQRAERLRQAILAKAFSGKLTPAASDLRENISLGYKSVIQ